MRYDDLKAEEAYALSQHRLLARIVASGPFFIDKKSLFCPVREGKFMQQRFPFSLLICLGLVLMACVFVVGTAVSAPNRLETSSLQAAQLCPPLAPASGTVVNVSTVAELENAVNTAVSGQTILIADGLYNLDGVYLRIDVPAVTLRSASGNREAVILDGNYITTEIIQIVASDVSVADVTLR